MIHSENKLLRNLDRNFTSNNDIPLQIISEYSEFYPHLIWTCTSKDSHLNKVGEKRNGPICSILIAF